MQPYPVIYPSLNLDFANAKGFLDPRVTFTRASTGTYYDNKTKALAEQNLLTYSQDYTQSVWSKQSSAITVTGNSSTAPDGTSTANLFTEDSINTSKSVYQSLSSVAGTYTASVYVKANIGTRFMRLVISSSGTNFSYVTVAMADGSITQSATSIGTPTNANATVTSVGNSWYRISLTTTLTESVNFIFLVPIDSGAAGLALNDYGRVQYVGNGSSFYVWGAQVEQRSSATTYNSTTTTAINNYIPVLQTAPINAPRFDFNPTTGESLGLLIEQSSTNLQPYSQDFSNGVWFKLNSSIISDTVIAPDGTQTADKLVENSATSGHYVYSVTTLTATSYTYSFYAKPSGRFNLSIGRADSNINFFTHTFNLNAGTTSGGVITPVGNNWYRCSGTITVNTGATTGIIISMADGAGATTYAGNGFDGIFIWGAQLEALPFSTSYIPTTSAQVTRAQDSALMTGTNFSSWWNYQQGTMFIDIASSSTTGNKFIGAFAYGADLSSIYATSNNDSTYEQILTTGFVTKFNANQGTANPPTKIALSYNVNTTTAIGTSNGATPSTSTTVASFPTPTQLFIGWNQVFNQCGVGRIRKFAYYPIAVTSAQLQALTGS